MPNPSFQTTFTPAALARRFLPHALGTAAIAALLLTASRLDLLPTPVPADLDRTILAAKAELASQPLPIDVLLLGDSSCMMNVDAPELSRRLNRRVLNLGTFSHLDLRSHAALLQHCLQTRSLPPSEVVLLMHPASLRRSSSEPAAASYLAACLSGETTGMLSPARYPAETALAGIVVRDRLIQPWVPAILRGDFATAYGSTRGIHRSLLAQAGSLADPSTFDPAQHQGRYELTPGSGLESASRTFRSAIPPTARLRIGLTPFPESLASTQHKERTLSLLQTWSPWLQPAQTLTNWPAVWPDSRFATATHLNAQGIQEFTALLADALTSDTPGPAPVPPPTPAPAP